MSVFVKDFIPVSLSNTRDDESVGFSRGLRPKDVAQCRERGERCHCIWQCVFNLSAC